MTADIAGVLWKSSRDVDESRLAVSVHVHCP